MNKKIYKKVLFFFAHPDDETLSAGGIINKLVKEGVKIKIVIASKGLLSRDTQKKIEIEKHILDLYQACSILGVNKKDLIIGDFKDSSFDSDSLLNLSKFSSKIVNKFDRSFIYSS